MSQRSKVKVVDGVACVGEPPVPVWRIKREWMRLKVPREIRKGYPQLTTEDLDAAWKYAHRHLGEMAEAIRADEQGGGA